MNETYKYHSYGTYKKGTTRRRRMRMTGSPRQHEAKEMEGLSLQSSSSGLTAAAVQLDLRCCFRLGMMDRKRRRKLWHDVVESLFM